MKTRRISLFICAFFVLCANAFAQTAAPPIKEQIELQAKAEDSLISGERFLKNEKSHRKF